MIGSYHRLSSVNRPIARPRETGMNPRSALRTYAARRSMAPRLNANAAVCRLEYTSPIPMASINSGAAGKVAMFSHATPKADSETASLENTSTT